MLHSPTALLLKYCYIWNKFCLNQLFGRVNDSHTKVHTLWYSESRYSKCLQLLVQKTCNAFSCQRGYFRLQERLQLPTAVHTACKMQRSLCKHKCHVWSLMGTHRIPAENEITQVQNNVKCGLIWYNQSSSREWNYTRSCMHAHTHIHTRTVHTATHTTNKWTNITRETQYRKILTVQTGSRWHFPFCSRLVDTQIYDTVT